MDRRFSKFFRGTAMHTLQKSGGLLRGAWRMSLSFLAFLTRHTRHMHFECISSIDCKEVRPRSNIQTPPQFPPLPVVQPPAHSAAFLPPNETGERQLRRLAARLHEFMSTLFRTGLRGPDYVVYLKNIFGNGIFMSHLRSRWQRAIM
jgi:hypothetical protein